MKKSIKLIPKKKPTMTLTRKKDNSSKGMNFPMYAQAKALKSKNKKYTA